MSFYTVPEGAVKTLTDIASLSPSKVKELSDFLAAHLEAMTTPSQALELTKSQSLKKIDAERTFEWLNALIPFIFNVVSKSLDPIEVVDDLVEAAERILREHGSEMPGSVAKKMRANLLAIFDNPKTKLKAKSIRLLDSHERGFSECEIISDIRPVFKADGEVEVEAAVMYHTLRIGHSGDGDDFYVALDSHDLQKLKAVVERAIEKERAIGKLIERTGVEHVKVS